MDSPKACSAGQQERHLPAAEYEPSILGMIDLVDEDACATAASRALHGVDFSAGGVARDRPTRWEGELVAMTT